MAEGIITLEEIPVVFASAANYVKSNAAKLKNQQLLEFYGLYKQATEGPCTSPKPSWYELTQKQKWEAWSALKNMDQTEAMKKYINLLYTIDSEWQEKPAETPSGSWVHHSCMENNDAIIKDSEKTIFDWVKEQNLDKVKIFGPGISFEINKLDENGLSLLHWAADRGSLDMVKYFVETLKADINVKDEDGQTPLHYAVSCEHESVVDYLINAGADTKIADNEGLTAFDSIRS